MARIGKGQKALDRAHKHRDNIEALLAITPRWALRDWFLDWTESQLRRDRFYIFSDKEHAVLEREVSLRLKPCVAWGDYTLPELLRTALAYRADCCEEDEDMLVMLEAEKPSTVPLWQMRWLVGLCRHVAGLPIPHIELEDALRAAERDERDAIRVVDIDRATI
jgi:hypothetical protein